MKMIRFAARAPVEPVPHQRERHQGAEDGGDDRGEQADLDAAPTAWHMLGSAHGCSQFSQGEGVEAVDQLAVGLVEAHQHDDGDRDEHVDDARAARRSGRGAA